MITEISHNNISCVTHGISVVDSFLVACIVTGDGDFYCLVDYLKKKGKLLKLMVPNEDKFSSLYRKLRPDIVFMNNLRGKMEFHK